MERNPRITIAQTVREAQEIVARAGKSPRLAVMAHNFLAPTEPIEIPLMLNAGGKIFHFKHSPPRLSITAVWACMRLLGHWQNIMGIR